MRIHAIAALLGLALAGPAHAKDMSGRFGLGVDKPLGFANRNNGGAPADGLVRFPGFSVVYRATPIFGIQLIFATVYDNIDIGPTRLIVTQLAGSLRGNLGLKLTDDVDLGLVFGGGGYLQRQRNGNVSDGTFDIALELGVRPEWFVTEDLSFHTQVGMVFAALDESDSGFSQGGIHVNVFGAADLVGNAGFTFWF
ncbi:MAG: hypothetical protein H6737_18410 [Alphaproteobacteria bacterium]|nr:hypothetical protein [Alphaproteobacteria bacterium]